jgi:hypothetical protein
MRTLALLLALASFASAEDRQPIRVTCRPVFVPNVGLPVEAIPHCVTIDGIDWDIDKLRAEYRGPWTWPDMTEQSLRRHMASEHRVPEIDRISFDDLKVIHSVIHEREQRTLKTKSMPSVPVRSNCPGGVCPSPMSTRSRSGFFFRWR